MPLTELFIECKETIRQRTRNLFPEIPADKLGFAPVEGALTLGQILRHLWMSEEGVTKIVSQGSWEYLDQRIPSGLIGVLGQIGTLQHELDNLERVHAQTVAMIRILPDDAFTKEHFHETLNLKRTTRSILLHLGEHEAHHRGQITTYLRILGETTPSLYPGFK